jgi:aminomethyltransferase
MEEKAVPRQAMPIEGGGEVTSGTHSPSLDVGIGMGYVPAASAAPDTRLTIDVRGRPRAARVVRKPIFQREERASASR